MPCSAIQIIRDGVYCPQHIISVSFPNISVNASLSFSFISKRIIFFAKIQNYSHASTALSIKTFFLFFLRLSRLSGATVEPLQPLQRLPANAEERGCMISRIPLEMMWEPINSCAFVSVKPYYMPEIRHDNNYVLLN
jgi:hypothetical protein